MKVAARFNVRLVKRFYEAFARRDSLAQESLLDPEIEWVEPDVPGLWFSGRHYGKMQVFDQVINATTSRIDNFRLEMKKFFSVGEHVIAIGMCCGRVMTTDTDLQAWVAHVWTVRDGKAVRLQAFHDVSRWQQAIDIRRPILASHAVA